MANPDTILVAALVAYGRGRMISRRIDDVREDVLDFAYETHGFDGDGEALWAAVRADMFAASKADRSHPSGRARKDPEPKAEPWEHTQDQALVTAPYRFTPVNRKVSRLKDDTVETPLNRPVPGNLSAVLDVVWRVETPLLIGEAQPDGSVQPFCLNDDWAIPGATLRGVIRAVIETIAFGRLFQINRHKRYALRDFVHPVYKDFITTGQGRPGLQAGWLCKTDVGAQITPCDWGYVPISDIVGSDDDSAIRSWIQKDRRAKYDSQNTDWTSKSAFTAKRAFAAKGTDDKGRRLYHAKASKQTGNYVFSGQLPGAKKGQIRKRFEYVFLDGPENPLQLHPDAWDRFETTNCKPSQNKRVPDGTWKEFQHLYEAGGRVPVFFVGDLKDSANPKFSFGLTRLYRIPHAVSLGDILLNSGKDHRPAERIGDKLVLKPDFVEHLFGYVYEPKELTFGHDLGTKAADYTPPADVARKGRVSFEFARPADATKFRLWPQDGPITTILGAPKPSFAPFYLVGTEKDYSAAGKVGWPQLAGRKRYITRFRAGTDDAPEAPLKRALAAQNADVVGDVKSHLRFLAPEGDAAFVGRIRLHNVSPAELGAVLWALTFGGDGQCRHLIGRGRAFGAGQVFAREITLNIRQNNASGQPDQPLVWTPDAGRSGLDAWFAAFESAIAGLLGFASVAAWKDSDEIEALLKIARPRGWEAPQTAYLPYQTRGGRQAEGFGKLRKKTGLGVARNAKNLQPPKRLLQP